MTYTLAVDLAIPMLGLLKRKAERIVMDTALKELKKRVEELMLRRATGCGSSCSPARAASARRRPPRRPRCGWPTAA